MVRTFLVTVLQPTPIFSSGAVRNYDTYDCWSTQTLTRKFQSFFYKMCISDVLPRFDTRLAIDRRHLTDIVIQTQLHQVSTAQITRSLARCVDINCLESHRLSSSHILVTFSSSHAPVLRKVLHFISPGYLRTPHTSCLIPLSF